MIFGAGNFTLGVLLFPKYMTLRLNGIGGIGARCFFLMRPCGGGCRCLADGSGGGGGIDFGRSE